MPSVTSSLCRARYPRNFASTCVSVSLLPSHIAFPHTYPSLLNPNLRCSDCPVTSSHAEIGEPMSGSPPGISDSEEYVSDVEGIEPQESCPSAGHSSVNPVHLAIRRARMRVLFRRIQGDTASTDDMEEFVFYLATHPDLAEFRSRCSPPWLGGRGPAMEWPHPMDETAVRRFMRVRRSILANESQL